MARPLFALARPDRQPEPNWPDIAGEGEPTLCRRRLIARPGQSVVVTLGAGGAMAVGCAKHPPRRRPLGPSRRHHRAGDCFRGVFAANLDEGADVATASTRQRRRGRIVPRPSRRRYPQTSAPRRTPWADFLPFSPCGRRWAREALDEKVRRARPLIPLSLGDATRETAEAPITGRSANTSSVGSADTFSRKGEEPHQSPAAWDVSPPGNTPRGMRHSEPEPPIHSPG